ncbi:hypothetical protein [uncultured Pseudodesulfovibrio sp.]|uniref:hypothetical protein n=1 Tax=uncultured Pseudodesulfovibrio sp. TaxID=2035858 RepID=UPI0029C70503|nr:hypothetical protein [uncultured Pseudodesulfovibrio sp.]
MLDKQIMEFVSLADDLGPFCRLSELKTLLESVSAEVRETPLYHYLHGLYDARCFFDNSHQNDLAKKVME